MLQYLSRMSSKTLKIVTINVSTVVIKEIRLGTNDSFRLTIVLIEHYIGKHKYPKPAFSSFIPRATSIFSAGSLDRRPRHVRSSTENVRIKMAAL